MAVDNSASAAAWGGLTIPPAGALNAVGSSAAERQLSIAAARAAVPLTYGEDRIAALILNVLPAAAGSNTLLVQCLWGFGGTSVSEVRLNDQLLPTGSTVSHYSGSQVSVDGALAAAFAAQGITYTWPLTGYMVSIIALPTRAFDGQLNITGLVRGRKLYDPRKDSTAGGSGFHRLANPATWEWSDCPALAQADFTSNAIYGAGLLVDWSTVGLAAAANDAYVASEKRRTLGISFLQPADVADMAETLRAYAGNFALPGANGVRFVPDADGAAVASYSHAAGNIADIQPLRLRDMGTAPTAVEVIWTDTSKVPWRDASAIAQLPGAGTSKPWRLSQVRLPGVTRYSQAMREATERLNKLTLNDLSTVIEVFDIGIRHDRGDLITLSHPLGLSNKPMRVNNVSMPAHGRWVLDVVEHDPAAYSDSVATQPSIPDTNFVNPAGPPGAPANVAVTLVPGAARFSWATPPEFDYAYTLIKTSTGSAPADIQVNAGNGSSYDWLWPALGSYSRWLVHVDTSGNASAPTRVDFTVNTSIYVPGGSVVPETGWLNSYATLGQNLLPNSDQTTCTWGIEYNPLGAVAGFGPILASEIGSWDTSNWVLAGGATKNCVVWQSDTTAGGNTAIAFDLYPLGTHQKSWIACVPGDRMCASVFVQTLNCAFEVYLRFYKADGTNVAGGDFGGATQSGSEVAANSLGAYTRAAAIGVAPAGAAMATLMVRKLNTRAGTGSSYIWLAAPQLERVNVNQAGPSPYQSGPATSPYQLGYKGDLNATNDIELVSNGGVTISGNAFKKVANGTGWTGSAYSRDSFTGGAFCSITANANQEVLFGLNDNAPDSASWEDINFAINLTAGGRIHVYQNGGRYWNGDVQGAAGTYSAGDVLAVVYDGSAVRYLKNGTAFFEYTSGVAPGLKLQFDGTIYYEGGSLNKVRFGPMSANNWASVGGRPLNLTIRCTGNGNPSPPANWWIGLRNIETDAAIQNSKRSWMYAEFSRSGQFLRGDGFDVYGAGEIGGTGYDFLYHLRNYITRGNILAVWTADEPYRNFWSTAGLAEQLIANGASRTMLKQIKDGGCYIMVGIVGCGEGRGSEIVTEGGGPNSWAELSFSIFNGSLNVSGQTGGPKSVKDLDYAGDLDATKGAPAGTYVGSNLAQDLETLAGAQAKANAAAVTAVSAAAIAAQAKADLAEINAKAHADGIVDAEEARAIADATAKANAAQAAAQAAAAADATAKANVAATLANWVGVSGRPFDYEQDSAPSGANEGSTWRQTSSGKTYKLMGGSWRPYVGPGSVGTGEIAPGAATLLAEKLVTSVAITGSSHTGGSDNYAASYSAIAFISFMPDYTGVANLYITASLYVDGMYAYSVADADRQVVVVNVDLNGDGWSQPAENLVYFDQSQYVKSGAKAQYAAPIAGRMQVDVQSGVQKTLWLYGSHIGSSPADVRLGNIRLGLEGVKR